MEELQREGAAAAQIGPRARKMGVEEKAGIWPAASRARKLGGESWDLTGVQHHEEQYVGTDEARWRCEGSGQEILNLVRRRE